MRPPVTLGIALAAVTAISLVASLALSRSMAAPWAIEDLDPDGGVSSEANAIDERGDVVGTVLTGGAPHAFLWRDGRLRDLGTLPLHGSSATASYAWDVAGDGLVIGSSQAGNPGDEHAFLWRDGRITDLYPSASSVDAAYSCCVTARASRIGEDGVIVGTRAVGETLRATMWRGRHLVDLGTLPGRPFSEAISVNAAGTVVGNSYTGLDDSGGYCMVRPRGFVWEHGQLRDLGLPPAAGAAVAVAINGRGQIVGQSGTADAICGFGSTPLHPFLLDRDGLRSLDIPGGGSVSAINDAGRVIGAMHRGGHARAFVWHDGNTTDLGALPWRPEVTATAINDRGQIVGVACAGEQERCRAILWESGRLVDLGTLPGGGPSYAAAINGRGQVVGYATARDGARHAVLWTRRPA